MVSLVEALQAANSGPNLMPRYFFHAADGSCECDKEGTELSNLDAARQEAVKLAGAVLRFQPEVLWNGGNFRVEVTDPTGMLLFTVSVCAVDA